MTDTNLRNDATQFCRQYPSLYPTPGPTDSKFNPATFIRVETEPRISSRRAPNRSRIIILISEAHLINLVPGRSAGFALDGHINKIYGNVLVRTTTTTSYVLGTGYG